MKAAAGAFAETGSDAGLTKTAVSTLTAVTGAFTATGQAARMDLSMRAATGAVAVTANAVNYKLKATTGAFTSDGAAAGMPRTYWLATTARSYAVTARPAGLVVVHAPGFMETGSFVSTGSDAGMSRGYALGAKVGVFLTETLDSTLFVTPALRYYSPIITLDGYGNEVSDLEYAAQTPPSEYADVDVSVRYSETESRPAYGGVT
jgi:hypothetical protein